MKVKTGIKTKKVLGCKVYLAYCKELDKNNQETNYVEAPIKRWTRKEALEDTRVLKEAIINNSTIVIVNK